MQPEEQPHLETTLSSRLADRMQVFLTASRYNRGTISPLRLFLLSLY